MSCFNHRQDPQRYLDALPLDRVVQIHLSGHSHCGTHIIDTHDDKVADPVWALYADVLRRAGRVPNTMIEWDADIPEWNVLVGELDRAREIARGLEADGSLRGAASVVQKGGSPVSHSSDAHRPGVALATEQQRLQDAILQGEGPVAEAYAGVWIRAKDSFPAAAQLGVYLHAYRARLHEVTAEDYPVLQHYLGAPAFDTLIDDFVRQTSSVHFNIARYTAGLPEHVLRVLPNDLLAQDLARLEDALCQVQDADETSALTTEHLAGVGADALQLARLAPRAASRLLAFSFPVDAYYTAVQEGEDPAPPAPQPSHLLVFRHDDVVWRMPLDAAEFELLQALSAGVPVGEACAALAQAELPDDEPVDAAIARWFSRWIRNGVLRDSLRLPTDATPSDPRPAPALAAMS